MISELVARSAWICPPVDGWAEGATPAAAGLALTLLLGTGAGLLPTALPSPAVPLAAATLLRSAARAARNVTASLLASAFFR